MIRYMTAGESHGPRLSVIIEGLPAGLALDVETVRRDLARRQNPAGAGGRMAIEKDSAAISAGVMCGKTTGAPVAMEIANRDHANWAGKEIPAYTAPRPGHADLVAALKYGFDDIRPALERASARETAARVAAGACFRALLAQFGISVSGRVAAIGGVPGDEDSPAVLAAIENARAAGETLGGIIEVSATGVPAGIGSYVSADRRLDARLAAAVLSVNAIKGVEFGDGFALSSMPGTQAQDAIAANRDGTLVRPSNHAGGIESGMSNGLPIVLRAAMKPIPTTLKPQRTVDLSTGESCGTKYERSDVCPVPRAVVVVEAAVLHVLADALCETLGGDTLDVMKARFASLPRPAAGSFAVTGAPKIFWR